VPRILTADQQQQQQQQQRVDVCTELHQLTSDDETFLYSPDLAPCDFFLFPKMEETAEPMSTCVRELLRG
jgi:hypothetical protein